MIQADSVRRAMRAALLAAAVFVSVRTAGAQELLWDVDFKFDFDNREYMAVETSPSKTIFGAMLSPKIGLGFSKGHALYVGADIESQFGRTEPHLTFDWLFYYQFDGPYFKVNAGSFPRARLTGYYPAAFFDDRYFLEGNVEGLMLSYTRPWWRIEGVVDWVGCIDRDTRERFEAYSYGEAGAPWLSAAYTLKMLHYAGSGEAGGVVDNVWVYPHLVSDLSQFLPQKMSLRLRAGWLQTFQNDRVREEGYVYPGGFQAEAALGYCGFEVRNTVYAGGNLMPFYFRTDTIGVMYGDNLYTGDMFYSTDSGVYNRLEISYHYDFQDFLRLKISSVHHYDGYGWGWQQLVQLTVDLSSEKWPKSHRPRHRR